MTHPTHDIRFSDSSLYDEVCKKCGATDGHGDTGLEKPCPAAEATKPQRMKNQGQSAFNDPELQRLLEEAKVRYDAMTPAQKHLMNLQQRRSWVVGEMGISHPEKTREELYALYAQLPEGWALAQIEHYQRERDKFQTLARVWAIHTFGEATVADVKLRAFRFMEEAAELCQAIGLSKTDAHRMVDYGYRKEPGVPFQEMGGVMVTLAVLGTAIGVDMAEAGVDELGRCWTIVDKIRQRQLTKPKPDEIPPPPSESISKNGSCEHDWVALDIDCNYPMDYRCAKCGATK